MQLHANKAWSIPYVKTGETMAELNLMADELGHAWPKHVYVQDNRPSVEVPLAILLTRLRIKNFAVIFSLHYHLYSLLCVISCRDAVFSKCSLFPYQKEKENEWFTLSLEGKREKPVNIKNVIGKAKRRNSYMSLCIPMLPSNVKYEVFFHATTHESAQSIIEKGIILRKGEERKDFSDSWGFYLGKDFDDVLRTRWARNRPPCSAVLEFRVAEAELRGSRNGLNLQGKIEKWQEVIQEFRGGPSREFRKEMQQYDFIEGPLFGEGQSLKNPMPNKGSYQLCVVSLDCAKFFDRHLHSIFFFEPDR